MPTGSSPPPRPRKLQPLPKLPPRIILLHAYLPLRSQAQPIPFETACSDRREAGSSGDQHDIPARWMYPAERIRPAPGAVFQGMGRSDGNGGVRSGRENPRRWLALYVAGGFTFVASARQDRRSRNPSGIGSDSSCGQGAVQCCRAGFRARQEFCRFPHCQRNRPRPPDSKAGLAQLI